ncbi:MAG: glycosyltransferase family 2 protein [Bdellovibrionales bacterium]|nr:glycosyltransferase family 2 protein [Bdellovibrionales bacterium]
MADLKRKISIICVNYENRTESEGFLRQFIGFDMSSISVLMVDNSERAKLPESICSLAQNARLVSSGKNLGYFGAFQFGIDFLSKDDSLGDFVILSNPDIRYEADFFERLIDLKVTGEIVLAPSVKSGLSGRDQNPFMTVRPLASRMLFYNYIFRFHPLFVLYEIFSGLKKSLLRTKGHSITNTGQSKPVDIYAPHGSLIVFTRSAIGKLSNFKGSPFLFCEEIYLAETSKKMDIKIKYEPTLRAVHKESTTMRLIPSKKISSYKARSNKEVYERFFAKMDTRD